MSIGTIHRPEWQLSQDDHTGRALRQFTSAPCNNYPLYYFIPTITPDGRYLVFHSERSGWVQLYRMDLQSGEIVQLTDARSVDTGWDVWCTSHLRGIYTHLSALNEVRGEVYYFESEQLRCTDLESLENRQILEMPGRISVGQTGFSPDGRHFAFIHADRDHFKHSMTEREALQNMGQFHWDPDHNIWRNQLPTTIGVIDVESGSYREVMALDYHVHHVFFLDDQTLLINHVKHDSGMWIIGLDGSGCRTLRPRDEHGAICHQVGTQNGIYYEANVYENGQRIVHTGRYDVAHDSFEEVLLPDVGYVHTGRDPLGRFLFYENQTETQHQLLTLHHPRDPERFELRPLRELAPIGAGQRFHAHPFLSPDRQWLFFTEVVDGFSQICALDVADLVDLEDYWV